MSIGFIIFLLQKVDDDRWGVTAVLIQKTGQYERTHGLPLS